MILSIGKKQFFFFKDCVPGQKCVLEVENLTKTAVGVMQHHNSPCCTRNLYSQTKLGFLECKTRKFSLYVNFVIDKTFIRRSHVSNSDFCRFGIVFPPGWIMEDDFCELSELDTAVDITARGHTVPDDF
ncbi:hypothetical protein B9Z55_024941 [Caenorhabditis nigoni]|uniref:Uncharacterized protein n=1 Tax=Caenorhabditis nigoni TaxID=1611254 RepID=A0A2G5SW57_9PELO|nr:hypothetical protein B9Z55_024941 [Caenorhabditis nigoni]